MKTILTLRSTAVILAAVWTASVSNADFEAASAHIDLDGTMVGYMDFSGDGEEIGTALNEIYRKALEASPQLPPIPVDFNQLFGNLGFGSLQAVAISSKDIEPGLHRNRSVALFDGEPAGLYALYGNKKTTFTAAELAPADATGAITASINFWVLRDTVSKVMQQIMGPAGEGMLQQQLSQVVPGSDLSYNELIETLSGKWDGFWHQKYSQGFQQEIKFWVRIEGAGSLLTRLRGSAESMGIVFLENEDSLKANLTPLFGEAPQIELFAEASKSDSTLTLYSNADWTPQNGATRLSESAEFKALAERLPEEGMAFTYTRESDLEPLMASIAAIPQVAPYAEAIETTVDLLLGDFMEPSMAVTVMKGNAMYTEEYAGYSTKQVITALPAILGGGLGAAMAIPAFQKVRSTSQEKTVTNNLRQIATAADQYFIEYGVTEVSIDELIGEFIPELIPVAGESYEGMVIRQGEDISVTLEDGTVSSIEF